MRLIRQNEIYLVYYQVYPLFIDHFGIATFSSSILNALRSECTCESIALSVFGYFTVQRLSYRHARASMGVLTMLRISCIVIN
jgi:hypothetical protein